MKQKSKKALEAEKDLYDLIPRFKSMHGHYLMDRSYESIRLLGLAARRLMVDCTNIMKTYDREEAHIDVQELLGY